MRGQVAPGSAVWLDGRALRVSTDGRFVFGFGRDAAKRAELVVRPPSAPSGALLSGAAPRQVERVNGWRGAR